MSKARSAVTGSAWGREGRFRRPLYDSYCFARLPATVKYLLLGRDEDRAGALPADAYAGLPTQYDNVVLFFIDAFGWHFFEKFADDYPFLKRFLREGRATPITSQFPSTTACHVTCIHTGVPVGQSGVFEWFYYEPRVGGVIAPLPFCYAGDKQRDTLKAEGLTAADIFPPGTIYQDLAGQGVASHVFQHSDYTPSTYSEYAFRGAEKVWPFKTLAEGLTNLVHQLRTPSDGAKRYFFLYTDGVDHLGHKYGPNSEYFAAEVDAVFTLLERLFYQKAAGQVPNTLVMMTADHGMVGVDPQRTVCVNRRPELLDLERYLRRSPRDGKPIKFGGSCRDLFLYVKDEALDGVEDGLRRAVGGCGEVWRVNELLREGFFGPAPGERLRQRLGNLVVLPYEGESVYWYEEGRFDMHYYGHHGGLTPGEMDTGAYLLPL
jgi:Type I phosphodiesterase / nucleotide pyrophosphatase